MKKETVELYKNWQMIKVNYKEILAETEEEVVCVCDLCKVAFKKRPYLCKCSSNFFLRDIKK